MYSYPAQVLAVVDGDTIDARLTLRDEATDLGFRIRMTLQLTVDLRLRFYAIDAPELRTDAGKVARQWLVDRLLRNGALRTYEPLTVDTLKYKGSDKEDSFGRYLAILHDSEGEINQDMVAAGQAVPFMVGPIPAT